MEKTLIYKDKNQTKFLLSNGLTQVIYQKGFNRPVTVTYAAFWHPYELRHYLRGYAAFSPISYIRLGKKIKSLGLCIEGNEDSWHLKRLLPAIAQNISMNAKPFQDEEDKRTVKQIYQTRENLLKRLKDDYQEYLN